MTDTLTNANLLRRGMGWGPLEQSSHPCNAHCALTGAAITSGYVRQDIIPDSTGNFLDLLRGDMAWLSEDAAICYSNDFRMGARLIFEDGAMFYPLIDRKAALEQGRPCWSDLVRTELPQRIGQRHLCLLNTDYKKRVWPRTPVAVVGEAMRWYVYAASRGVAAVLRLSLTRLIATLDLVEEVYTYYPKRPIEMGLWDAKLPTDVTWAQMSVWEAHLRSLRTTCEFTVSIIVAQKGALQPA